MSTVNNLRVVDWIHNAAKYKEELQDRPPKQQEETYVGLPIHQLTELNLQRWQIAVAVALALMSSLQVLGAIEC